MLSVWSTPSLARRSVGAALGLALLFGLMTSVYYTAEAVEEREVAGAALEVKVAVADIAHADTVEALGGEPDLTSVSRAVDVLDRHQKLAIRALERQQVARLDWLLSDIRITAAVLLGELEDLDPVKHDHTEILRLLNLATGTAADRAARSERNAATAIGVAILALVAAGRLVDRSRQRTARARAGAELEIREGQRLQRLLDDSPDILFVINSAGSITFRSEGASGLLVPGADSVADVVALAEADAQSDLHAHLTQVGPDRGSEVFRLCTDDGRGGWFDVRVSDLTSDELVDGLLVTAREITTEVELRRELERQATTDVLTGLPNRRGLEPAIAAAKEAMTASGQPMAFLILDVDGFKKINDTLGHPAGDELLISIATRLTNALRDDATLVRMGGDEFAVIVPTLNDTDEARRIAERLQGALDKPFRLAERLESVHTSAGVALANDVADVDDLIIHADIALYAAKRRSGTSVTVYNVALESTITRANQLARALADADDDEFSLVYQPIVAVGTGDVVGLEALLRWSSPQVGIVGPDEFIPIAESSGEICAIGEWVLENVCRQLSAWIDGGLSPHITVSVNVSAQELTESGFVASVLEATRRWSIPPDRLVIEVTETVALDRTGLAGERLQELMDAGFRISIDDFGSGYSNLGRLISVPFDLIKIDRSLLTTLTEMRRKSGDDPTRPCAIMQAIVSIAGILNAPVICEGVETEEQRASLEASGITYLQGFLTGRPAPPDAISELLIGLRV